VVDLNFDPYVNQLIAEQKAGIQPKETSKEEGPEKPVNMGDTPE
jgi:hypothetical protein